LPAIDKTVSRRFPPIHISQNPADRLIMAIDKAPAIWRFSQAVLSTTWTEGLEDPPPARVETLIECADHVPGRPSAFGPRRPSAACTPPGKKAMP